MKAFLQNESWLWLAEIADYMGVSKDAIRNWLKKSGMPAHKVGKLFLISSITKTLKKTIDIR